MKTSENRIMRKELTKNTKDKYYAFFLDDYATVSFVSGGKVYFGTMDDFARLLKDKRNEKFIEPYEKFKKGNRTVECAVAYGKHRFAYPVHLLDTTTETVGAERYEHTNIYGFPYYILYDKKVETRYLIKYKNMYHVAYRLQLENMRCEDTMSKLGEWKIRSFWGFPSMIQNISNNPKKSIHENVLLELTEAYPTEEEARAVFSIQRSLNYEEFYNDIFGDG